MSKIVKTILLKDTNWSRSHGSNEVHPVLLMRTPEVYEVIKPLNLASPVSDKVGLSPASVNLGFWLHLVAPVKRSVVELVGETHSKK